MRKPKLSIVRNIKEFQGIASRIWSWSRSSVESFQVIPLFLSAGTWNEVRCLQPSTQHPCSSAVDCEADAGGDEADFPIASREIRSQNQSPQAGGPHGRRRASRSINNGLIVLKQVQRDSWIATLRRFQFRSVWKMTRLRQDNRRTMHG